MWVILPAVSLAIVHIAGDNLAVVPDMAALLGTSIYITSFFAYMVFGVFITGVSAWIGVKTGQELIVVVRRLFGCRGKRLMALTIIAVCIPASALTGCYFSGAVLSIATGIPYYPSSFLCLLFVSILATGWGGELLRISNYFSLLLIPALTILISSSPTQFASLPQTVTLHEINWPLVLALIGYNAGGMRPALVVEAASYLSRIKNKAIILAVVAKLVEGIITLMLAHIIVVTGSVGPLALSSAAAGVFESEGLFLFNLLLLSTFINTMVPAMTVNARQIGVLTGLSYRWALAVGGLIVAAISLTGFEMILWMLSITGLLMAIFILLTAIQVHKLPAAKS